MLLSRGKTLTGNFRRQIVRRGTYQIQYLSNHLIQLRLPRHDLLPYLTCTSTMDGTEEPDGGLSSRLLDSLVGLSRILHHILRVGYTYACRVELQLIAGPSGSPDSFSVE